MSRLTPEHHYHRRNQALPVLYPRPSGLAVGLATGTVTGPIPLTAADSLSCRLPLPRWHPVEADRATGECRFCRWWHHGLNVFRRPLGRELVRGGDDSRTAREVLLQQRRKHAHQLRRHKEGNDGCTCEHAGCTQESGVCGVALTDGISLVRTRRLDCSCRSDARPCGGCKCLVQLDAYHSARARFHRRDKQLAVPTAKVGDHILSLHTSEPHHRLGNMRLQLDKRAPEVSPRQRCAIDVVRHCLALVGPARVRWQTVITWREASV